MLSDFYQWIKNIAAYLIFMSLMLKLLPEGKNIKYIKYFMGMILVLIVLAPAGKLFHLDEVFAGFEEELYEQEKHDAFREELELKGEEYADTVTKQYEEQLASQVSAVIRDGGYGAAAVKASLDSDLDSETFGQLVSLEVVFSSGQQSGGEESGQQILIEKRKIRLYDEDALTEETKELNYKEAAEEEALRELLSERFSIEAEKIIIRRD